MVDYNSSAGLDGGSDMRSASLGAAHHTDHLHLPSPEGLIHLIARQWRAIALLATIAVMLAGLYLLVSPPQYTSAAKLRVEPLGQQVLSTGGEGAGQGQISSEFLVTECDVITSNPVLALALSKIGPSAALDDASSPLEALRAGLTADVAKRGQTIVVSFESREAREGDRIVAAVVEAYQVLESDHLKKKVKDSLDLIASGREHQRSELTAKTQRMLELARNNGASADPDPDRNPIRAQIRSLTEAVTRSHLETLNAKSAYDQAARAIVGDNDRLQQVDAAVQQPVYAANPAAQLITIQTELSRQQARLLASQRQYMPGHPIVKTIQSRIDQLTVASIVAADQWCKAAQAKEDVLQKSLDEAQQSAMEQQTRAVEYAQLTADVGQLKKMDDILDGKLKDVDLIRGATNITVLNPPQVSGPPRPLKGRTLGVALALGLFAGFGVGCVRDARGGRLRNAATVQKIIGAPVLGTVPAMLTAFTPIDRGQIVNNDPFGAAAEAYRALQQMLAGGLPPRTKTLLVTSPVTGEGKSTLLSNLAIAMAQANKRVLILDANFRSPAQHQLFDLPDSAGFATVLAGDDTLDSAIQRTAIERLELLPSGRSDTVTPEQMLNDPAFTEHLNELADKYDLVLIDAPAMSRGVDARVIAACADATLLVVRPDLSTRRQAEHARDGLRGVGARVIGVTLNAVARGSANAFPTARPQPRASTAPAKPARTPTLRNDRQRDPRIKPTV